MAGDIPFFSLPKTSAVLRPKSILLPHQHMWTRQTPLSAVIYPKLYLLERRGVPTNVVVWVFRFRSEDLIKTFGAQCGNAIASIPVVVDLWCNALQMLQQLKNEDDASCQCSTGIGMCKRKDLHPLFAAGGNGATHSLSHLLVRARLGAWHDVYVKKPQCFTRSNHSGPVARI
jgi:hypothetical protein